MGLRKLAPLEVDKWWAKKTLEVTSESFPWRMRLKLAAELWRQQKTETAAEALCKQIDAFCAEIDAYQQRQAQCYPRGAFDPKHGPPKFRIYTIKDEKIGKRPYRRKQPSKSSDASPS